MEFEITYKWVFALMLVPVLIYILWPALHKRRSGLLVPFFNRAASLSDQHFRKRAWISRKNIFVWLTLLLCWICLLAAASSPRYVGKPAKEIKTVRSFMIATDISLSMATTDWQLKGHRISRWGVIKSIMKGFIKARKSDEVGLIMFGSNAYLQAPFTTDLETVDWLMDQTEVGMAGQMTSIGNAIAYSIKIFRQDTIKKKVMLLLTDGIDSGKDILPLDAAEAAKRDSIVIYTIGIGRSKGSGGYDLDEKTLQAIARTTGGKYFNAMNSLQLKQVYAMLDKLHPVVYQQETYKPVVLLYYYPLTVAILLALLFHFISGTIHLIKRGN